MNLTRENFIRATFQLPCPSEDSRDDINVWHSYRLYPERCVAIHRAESEEKASLLLQDLYYVVLDDKAIPDGRRKALLEWIRCLRVSAVRSDPKFASDEVIEPILFSANFPRE